MKELWWLFDSVAEALWDPATIITVQEFFGPGWSPLFGAVTFLATIKAVAVVISLALWLGGRRLAYSLVGAVLLAAATNSLLWTLVGLPRPDDAEIVVRAHVGVSSFPSGHVVTATVVYGLLAALHRIPTAVALVVVPAVILSRLYLGAHYLGDVLGGLVIGLLLVAAFLRLWPIAARWLSRRSFWFFLIVGLCAPLAALVFIGLSPRGWEIFGAALGAGIGMPLEYRYVRFSAAKATLRQQALKVAVGLGVMGALLLAHGVLFSGRPILDAALLTLAVLWGVLVAPALFVRVNLCPGRS